MMKTRNLSISGLLALAVMVLVFGWAGVPSAIASPGNEGLPVLPKNPFGFMDLRVEQLAKSMSNKNFTLVNVHVPVQASLPNTDLSIPFDQIKGNLAKLPRKDAAIVIYCRSGGMSVQAAATLAAAGYTEVYDLKGGFNAWKAAGHRLLNK